MIISNGAEVAKPQELLQGTPCLRGECSKLLTLAREYGVQYWTNGSCGEDGSPRGECLKVGMTIPTSV